MKMAGTCEKCGDICEIFRHLYLGKIVGMCDDCWMDESRPYDAEYDMNYLPEDEDFWDYRPIIQYPPPFRFG